MQGKIVEEVRRIIRGQIIVDHLIRFDKDLDFMLSGMKATITPIIQIRIKTVMVLHFPGLKHLKGYTMQIYFSSVRNVKSNTDTSVDRMARDPRS